MGPLTHGVFFNKHGLQILHSLQLVESMGVGTLYMNGRRPTPTLFKGQLYASSLKNLSTETVDYCFLPKTTRVPWGNDQFFCRKSKDGTYHHDRDFQRFLDTIIYERTAQNT